MRVGILSQYRSETVWDDLGVESRPIAVYAGLHGVGQGLDQLLAAAEKLRDEQLSFVLMATAQKRRCWSTPRAGEACET